MHHHPYSHAPTGPIRDADRYHPVEPPQSRRSRRPGFSNGIYGPPVPPHDNYVHVRRTETHIMPTYIESHEAPGQHHGYVHGHHQPYPPAEQHHPWSANSQLSSSTSQGAYDPHPQIPSWAQQHYPPPTHERLAYIPDHGQHFIEGNPQFTPCHEENEYQLRSSHDESEDDELIDFDFTTVGSSYGLAFEEDQIRHGAFGVYEVEGHCGEDLDPNRMCRAREVFVATALDDGVEEIISPAAYRRGARMNWRSEEQ